LTASGTLPSCAHPLRLNPATRKPHTRSKAVERRAESNRRDISSRPPARRARDQRRPREVRIMSEITTKTLPVLPLRDIVVFPHMVVPLFVGREKSVKALDEIMKGEKQILLATQ